MRTKKQKPVRQRKAPWGRPPLLAEERARRLAARVEDGERFRQARSAAGKTQKDAQAALGTCLLTISRWENGHSRIPEKAWAWVRALTAAV